MPFKEGADRSASNKRHYEKNKHVYIARNKRAREAIIAAVAAAKNVPCADCGGRFLKPAMDFDHRPDQMKRFNIANISVIPSLKALKLEMEKCDVVCANCHRIRTWQRQQDQSGVGELADPLGSDPRA